MRSGTARAEGSSGTLRARSTSGTSVVGRASGASRAAVCFGSEIVSAGRLTRAGAAIVAATGELIRARASASSADAVASDGAAADTGADTGAATGAASSAAGGTDNRAGTGGAG